MRQIWIYLMGGSNVSESLPPHEACESTNHRDVGIFDDLPIRFINPVRLRSRPQRGPRQLNSGQHSTQDSEGIALRHCPVAPQSARAFTHRTSVAPPSHWSITT